MLEIKDWHQRYEVTFRGKEAKLGDELRVGPLRYIRMKVHGYQQGTGQRKLKLLAGERAMEVYGIFCKFLEIAGDLPKEQRGTLLNEDGNPATAKDLAFILDVPQEQIEHAVEILTQSKLCWLANATQKKLNTNTIDTHTQGILKAPVSSHKSPEIPLPPTPEGDKRNLSERAEFHLKAWLDISNYKADMAKRMPSNRQMIRADCEIYDDVQIIGAIQEVGPNCYSWLRIRDCLLKLGRVQRIDEHHQAQIKATRERLRRAKERAEL